MSSCRFHRHFRRALCGLILAVPAMAQSGVNSGLIEGFPMQAYIGVNGSVSSGQLILPESGIGPAINQDIYSINTSFGLVGSKRIGHDSVSVSYQGTQSRFLSGGFLQPGFSQSFSGGWSHRLNRKLTISFSPSASRFSGGSSGVLAGSSIDAVTHPLAPTSEIYSNATAYFQANLGLNYQLSHRVAMSFSGDGYITKRSSFGLENSFGRGAGFGIGYAINRRSQIGLSYGYYNFGFTRSYGAYHMNSLSASYSRRFGSRLSLSAAVGAARVDSLSTQLVPLRPDIAAILGEATYSATVYSVQYSPVIQFSLGRSIGRGSASLSYGQAINSGNGLTQAASSRNFSASYSRSLNRVWRADVSGNYARTSGLVSEFGQSSGVTAGAGTTYQFARNLNFNLRGDWQKYNGNSLFARGTHTFSFGMYYSLPVPGFR